MSHLSHEMLWAAAKAEVNVDAQSHLALCEECRTQLENVRFAQSVLVEPPPAPELQESSARRIGDVLRSAAEKQAERRARLGWWPFNFNPAWMLAPVAAALLAFAAYLAQPSQPELPVAKNEPAPQSQPMHVPMPEIPQTPPPKKLLAQVTSAKNARHAAGVLKKAQALSEGSTVETSKGGSLWMKLPDGSRAGLSGASQVQLAKLEEKSVTLDVTLGNLVVVARHDPSRVLRVRAGELQVVDVGTRFLVSRDDKRTLVAVEEGSVDVETPGKKVPVRAGQAVEWRDGKLSTQAWGNADEPKASPPVAVAQPSGTKLSAGEDTPPIPSETPAPKPPPEVAEPQPPPTAPSSNPDEWAPAPSGQPNVAPIPPPPPPPSSSSEPDTAPVALAPSPTGPESDEADESFLKRLERKLGRMAGPLIANREQRARDITFLVESRSCTEALVRADKWLSESVPHAESFHLRRSVLTSKLACLNYQGRTGDAQAVQRELQKL